MLLQHLSVFVSGWSVDAAGAVCADKNVHASTVLDLLDSLVDQSLVGVEHREDANRYRLLETVRQYAIEKSCQSAEHRELMQRHAAWYLALAERAQGEISGREQTAWLERLTTEHDNLRAALVWARTEAPQTGLRLAANLGSFWEYRGHAVEGRRWLEELIPLVPERTALRAMALRALGELVLRADFTRARSALEESVSISTQLGDSRDRAAAMRLLGSVVWKQG
jgi:non-specific serine/threonine protein kinase